MKTIDIPIPLKRCRCIVCGKKLNNGDDYADGLTICTTDGSIVLTCQDHAERGDVVVQAVQLYAKGPKSKGWLSPEVAAKVREIVQWELDIITDSGRELVEERSVAKLKEALALLDGKQ